MVGQVEGEASRLGNAWVLPPDDFDFDSEGEAPPTKKKVSRELTRFPALSQSTIKFKSNYCPVAVF